MPRREMPKIDPRDLILDRQFVMTDGKGRIDRIRDLYTTFNDQVDLQALKENIRLYRESLQSPHEIMAVVKANAYGHGDVQVSKTLQECGIRHFAVSNIEEAIRLRMAGVTGQILILGYTPCDQAERLHKYDITQAIVDEAYAAELRKCGLRVKVQAALDTGMNRIGLDAEKPEDCERAIRQYANDFELTGLFTHLCVADTDTESCRAFTKRQEELFTTVAERVADLHLPYVHCGREPEAALRGFAKGASPMSSRSALSASKEE